jgi:hypothetical protein
VVKMEKYIEQMRRLVDLAETGLEGLEHIQKKLSEGLDQSTIMLITDVITAFNTIEQSVDKIPSESITLNSVGEITNQLRRAFDYLVTALEEGSEVKVREILQFTLLPVYKNWKKELEGAFNPYLLL